jgi:signal transduction histidine kinase
MSFQPETSHEEAAIPHRVPAPPSEPSPHELQLSHSERLASLGILAAGVAHEILNPLASVLAGVEALRRRIVEAPGGLPSNSVAEAKRVLDILEQDTGRARDIANKMMLLARPDSEAPAWVDVNRAVEDSVALLRYQMNVQDIQTSPALEHGLAPIWARGGGVRSVCMNLVMNAVQAMPRGGTLTLRTRGDGRMILIEVEDTGPGIPVDLLGRIWDPFYTTKPPGTGTGLGLSISRKIVEQHDGSIKVRNVEPRGARFTVELPIRARR